MTTGAFATAAPLASFTNPKIVPLTACPYIGAVKNSGSNAAQASIRLDIKISSDCGKLNYTQTQNAVGLRMHRWVWGDQVKSERVYYRFAVYPLANAKRNPFCAITHNSSGVKPKRSAANWYS